MESNNTYECNIHDSKDLGRLKSELTKTLTIKGSNVENIKTVWPTTENIYKPNSIILERFENQVRIHKNYKGNMFKRRFYNIKHMLANRNKLAICKERSISRSHIPKA